MRTPRRHPSFFSTSLKQVEERLKSEEKPQQAPPPLPNISPSLSDSAVPLEFLSQSLGFSASSSLPPPPEPVAPEPAIADDADDISRLLGLLGVSVSADEENGGLGEGELEDFSDSGFYGKVVGIKGPKSGKEARRLDGWIRYLIGEDGDGVREPLRLAHLIMGKAIYLNVDGLDQDVKFPTTVEEFLRTDPPSSSTTA